MNRFKKMLTISVLSMTVLSMTVVISPVSAAAATDGDIIMIQGKKAGAAVYYFKDGKYNPFPDENVYKTYFLLSNKKADWSKLKKITQAEFDTYNPGKNVVLKGGTNLVSFSDNPGTTYAVETNGVIRKISSATAATLYGANWSKMVVTETGYLRDNYTVGADMTADKYPAGTVVEYPAGSNNLFYYDGTNYRAFSNADLAITNGFNKAYIIPTSIAIVAGGTAITGVEAGLSALAIKTGTSTGPATGTGSGLTVALASDTPAAATYVRNSNNTAVVQSVAPFTKINFTASNDGDVVVTTVKLTRSGISADTDLQTVYLYDGTTRLAEHTSISNKVITFTNSAGLFTVPKGTTKSVMVKVDLAGGTSTVSGIVLGINAAADIVAGTAAVTGSFPINGNSMGVGTVTDLGYLNIATIGAANQPTTIDPGVTGYEVFRFNVTANSQQMNLESLKLTLVGTLSTGDVANFMLKDTSGTQIGSTVTAMSASKEVIFDATANPYKIASGQTKTLVVYADVPNGSGRNFRFTIRKVADVVVKDNGYGIYTAPLYNSAAFVLIDPGSSNFTTINNGTITSGVDATSPTGNVAGGATGVTLAAFSIKANGEDIKVTTLRMKVVTSATTDGKNGKLFWNGTQIGSTDTVVTNNTSVAFTANQVIKAGTTAVIRYDMDTTDNTQGTALTGTVYASLQANTAGDATGQSSLSDVSITGVTGKTLTFAAGTLTVAKNASVADAVTATPSGVRGATNLKVASFVITAGTGEASTITQIALRDNRTVANHSATEGFGTNFQNLKLMHAGTQVGVTQGSLTHLGADVFTFSISPAITIGAGQQYVVDVYADSLSGSTGFTTPADNNFVGLEVASVTGTGATTSTATTVTASAGTKPLQKIYIAASGNLNISLDSTNPVGQYLVMGSTANTIGAFRLEATTSPEDINVSVITIKDSATTYEAGYSNIQFYDGSTLLGTVAAFSSGAATLNLATNWVIPKGTAKVLTIKADVGAYPNATSNGTMTIKINAASDVTAIGAGSGTALSAGSTLSISTGSSAPTANQMTFAKTKLTIAPAPGTPSGVSGKSTEQTVAIFRFTNSSNIANQQAKVIDLAMNVITGNTWTTLSPTASIKVYQNSVATGNLLGTSAAATSPTSVALNGWTLSGDTNGGATSLKDFTIAAGSYIDIYVTANTTGAPTNGTLTASIPSASGIKWDDGVTTDGSLNTVDSLPVTAGTLTY